MTRGEPLTEPSRDRWSILAAALLVQVTISVVTQSFPVLAPFARGNLHMNAAQVGLFATILNLGTMGALLPAGWAVDVLGERRVLVAGGIATGLATLLAATAPQFIVLLPLLLLVGVTSATPTPAGSTAIISAFSGRDRGLVMSIRQTGIPLGGALAALLLPPLAVAAGWRRALQVAAVVAVAGAVAGLALLRRSRPAGLTARPSSGSVREVATRDATLIGLAAIFLTLGQFVLVSYIALYLLTLWHLPLTVGSLFLVAANVGGIAGRMLWGSVSDRLFSGRRRAPLMLVSVAAAAGFVILAWLPAGTPLIVMLLLVLLLGTTVIGWNGVYVTLLSEIAPPDKRGRSVAYGLTISQVGIFGGPVAFGAFIDLTGSYRLGWTLVALGMLAAALLMRQVREGTARGVPALTG